MVDFGMFNLNMEETAYQKGLIEGCEIGITYFARALDVIREDHPEIFINKKFMFEKYARVVLESLEEQRELDK